MAYAPEHYIAVFEAMRRQFGETWYSRVNPVWWNIWRGQIKTLFFDQNILISEMVAGIEEAAMKIRWPYGKAFFYRLHDVCLKNRREQPGAVKRDAGLRSLKDLLPR